MMTTVKPITSTTETTEPQDKQYKRLVEDAASRGIRLAREKVPLTKDGMQRLLGRGNEILEAVAEVIIAKTMELSELPYADEEKPSNYHYPKAFTFLSVEQQLEVLAKYFGGLDASHVMDEARKHESIVAPREFLGVWPKYRLLAAQDDEVAYNTAVIAVTDKIGETRPFNNYRKGELGPKYLRLLEQTKKLWLAWEDETPGDFIVRPCQFGKHHAGKSPRRARVVVQEGEALLGSYMNGILLLTHPNRICGEQIELYMDCSGDEYSPHAGGDFPNSLCFYWSVGRLDFGNRFIVDTFDYYGSVSAFVGAASPS